MRVRLLNGGVAAAAKSRRRRSGASIERVVGAAWYLGAVEICLRGSTSGGSDRPRVPSEW